MKISIIGTGEIGGTIARKLAKAGHQVSIANSRGKESVKKFAEEIGAEPRDLEEISKDADISILSIPFGAIPKLSKDIFNNLPKSSIIIDTNNYYPEIRKENIDETKPEIYGFQNKLEEKLLRLLIHF